MPAPRPFLVSTILLSCAAGVMGCADDAGTPARPDGGLDAAGADAAGADAPAAAADGAAADSMSPTACPALGALQPPSVPAALAPPTGATLLLRTRATGTQIYTCAMGAMAGVYAWTFKAPDAQLFDEACAAVGTHGMGPFWAWTADGSRVTGAAVASSPAPAAGAIPWLVLRATTSSGSGRLGQVTAIQRVDTAGGVAPATGCDATAAGKEAAVPYTALYYFYTGASFAVPDAGAQETGSAAPDAADAPAADR
jgi:hypothetical protein